MIILAIGACGSRPVASLADDAARHTDDAARQLHFVDQAPVTVSPDQVERGAEALLVPHIADLNENEALRIVEGACQALSLAEIGQASTLGEASDPNPRVGDELISVSCG